MLSAGEENRFGRPQGEMLEKAAELARACSSVLALAQTNNNCLTIYLQSRAVSDWGRCSYSSWLGTLIEHFHPDPIKHELMGSRISNVDDPNPETGI